MNKQLSHLLVKTYFHIHTVSSQTPHRKYEFLCPSSSHCYLLFVAASFLRATLLAALFLSRSIG